MTNLFDLFKYSKKYYNELMYVFYLLATASTYNLQGPYYQFKLKAISILSAYQY